MNYVEMAEMSFPQMLLGIGSQIVNQTNQAYASRQQQQASMEATRMQYAMEYQQWLRQNEYNLPINQMKRLREAGLNPNLVYGNGTVTGNTTSNMPVPRVPVYNVPKMTLPDIIGMYQDFRIRNLQTDNLEQQNRIDKANADIAELNRDLTVRYKDKAESYKLAKMYNEVMSSDDDARLRFYNAEMKRIELDDRVNLANEIIQGKRDAFTKLRLENEKRQKELQFFTENAILKLISSGIGSLTGFKNFVVK